MKVLAAVAAACVVCVACGGPEAVPRPTAPPGGVVVRFERASVAAELANEPKEWYRGLMLRRRLGRDHGMLFTFPVPTTTSFYMKNTLIPLSIAFLERTGVRSYRVMQIRDMVPCRREPCRRYPPKAAYDATLEVNRGWFARAGIGPGAVARLER